MVIGVSAAAADAGRISDDHAKRADVLVRRFLQGGQVYFDTGSFGRINSSSLVGVLAAHGLQEVDARVESFRVLGTG